MAFRRWKGDFQVGDVVRYVGPDTGADPIPGQRGTLITPGDQGDPPPAWVVAFGTTEIGEHGIPLRDELELVKEL